MLQFGRTVSHGEPADAGKIKNIAPVETREGGRSSI